MLVLLMAGSASAADWALYRSSHFEMYTDAKAGDARDTLVELEQFRYVFGKILRIDDIKMSVRSGERTPVILFRSYSDGEKYLSPGPFQEGETDVMILLAADRERGADFRREYARRLLEANINRMPEAVEQGLVALFSTLRTDQTKVIVGEPVPPAERSAAWARMHMLAVHPDYYGKLPVLLHNLENGVDEGPAYRNSFGKDRPTVLAEADRYLKAGQFDTAPAPSLPIDAEREYPKRELDSAKVDQVLNGLLHQREAEAEYAAAIRDAKSGRDVNLTRIAAGKAQKLRPGNPEPYVLLASAETDVSKKIELLKTAAGLARRDAAIWDALGEAYIAAHEYGEAAKAWRSAEQAAATLEVRRQMQDKRSSVDDRRLDWEAAERRRKQDEEAQELERLKAEAVARIRAAEAKANAGNAPPDTKTEVVPWWDGPAPEGKLRGRLTGIECLGNRFRLSVAADGGKVTKLMISDPGTVTLTGGGEKTLGCGPQSSRAVTIEYFLKPDKKLGTAGEVATIEFR